MNEVEECIMNLDSFSSPGPDNIHQLFVKKFLINISGRLTKLINQSIRKGIFHEVWKIDLADINNYRPISKYSVFAKIMDCLVCSKLSAYLNKYIIDQQHGFLPGLSTTLLKIVT